MAPLVAAMDHPRPRNQVKVGIMDDPHVNAASAGGGEFYVTSGLLQKANVEHLRGVLAHELAHDDLGHVAKAQALGAGLGIGMIILDQIFPGAVASHPSPAPWSQAAIAAQKSTQPSALRLASWNPKPTSVTSPVSRSNAALAPSQLVCVHPCDSPLSGARRRFAVGYWTKVQ